jgi:hypothetical protein
MKALWLPYAVVLRAAGGAVVELVQPAGPPSRSRPPPRYGFQTPGPEGATLTVWSEVLP